MKYTKDIIAKRTKLAKHIETKWPHRKGKLEFIKSLLNKDVTRVEAIIAKCYECCGGYDDGPYDCQAYTCPLYCFMPYSDARSRKELTPEERELLLKRFAEGRAKKKAEKGD